MRRFLFEGGGGGGGVNYYPFTPVCDLQRKPMDLGLAILAWLPIELVDIGSSGLGWGSGSH